MPTINRDADPAFDDAAARLAEAAAAAAAESAARADEPLTAAPPEYYEAKAAEEAANIAADDAAADDASQASQPAAGDDDDDPDEPFSPPQAWTESASDRKDPAADSERREANAPEHGRKAGEQVDESDDGENGSDLAGPGGGMSGQADLMGSVARDGGMVGYGHGQADEHRADHGKDQREEDPPYDE